MNNTIGKIDPNHQIILIGATNHPQTLDSALRQAGRFGLEIYFEYPTFKERKEYIEKRLEKLSIPADLLNVDKIARESNNQSFAAIKTFLDAIVLRARLGGAPINQDLAEFAIDEELYHIVKHDTKELPEQESTILSTHYAGEAVAYHLFNSRESYPASPYTASSVMPKKK